MAIEAPPRLRQTAQRQQNGEWNWDEILNRELYPAINGLRASVVSITSILNRFVPKFVAASTYAITALDENALIIMDSAVACTVTMDSAVADTYPDGACIAMMQFGLGQVTFVETGFNVHEAETQRTRKQYSGLFISRLRSGDWWLTGDMELF